MKKALIILAGCLLSLVAFTRPFALTFDVSQEPTNVVDYGAYVATTSNPAGYVYVGHCAAPGAEIDLDTTNMPANPCYLAVTAGAATGPASGFSVPLLFDTNNIVWPVLTPTNPVVVVPVLFPPLNLQAHGL
jgi:hypothetical protein